MYRVATPSSSARRSLRLRAARFVPAPQPPLPPSPRRSLRPRAAPSVPAPLSLAVAATPVSRNGRRERQRGRGRNGALGAGGAGQNKALPPTEARGTARISERCGGPTGQGRPAGVTAARPGLEGAGAGPDPDRKGAAVRRRAEAQGARGHGRLARLSPGSAGRGATPTRRPPPLSRSENGLIAFTSQGNQRRPATTPSHTRTPRRTHTRTPHPARGP